MTIKSNASDYISAGDLSQLDAEKVLHPMTYYSKSHTLAECIYAMDNKELIAKIRVLEKWRPDCEWALHPLQ